MSTTSWLSNIRSLLPGPFYNCFVPVFTNSGSLQTRQVVYSSCSLFCGIQLLCGKYTEGFVLCQVFFVVSGRSPTHARKCCEDVLIQKCPTSHPKSVLFSIF